MTSRTHRLVLLLVAALGLPLLLAVTVAPPAQACSCEQPDLAADLRAAGDVFVGSVVDSGVYDDEVRSLLDVETVYGGQVTSSETIVTSYYGTDSCGGDALTEGSTFLVVPYDEDADGHRVGPCSGLWGADAENLSIAREVLGEPTTPLVVDDPPDVLPPDGTGLVSALATGLLGALSPPFAALAFLLVGLP